MNFNGSSVVAKDLMIARGVLQARKIESLPPYDDITICGLHIKAGRVNANASRICDAPVVGEAGPGALLLYDGTEWAPKLLELGGELGGAYSDAIVKKICGKPIDPGEPSCGSVLYYDGESWKANNSLPILDPAEKVYYGTGTSAGCAAGAVTFGHEASTRGAKSGIAIGQRAVVRAAGAIALGPGVTAMDPGSFNVTHRTGEFPSIGLCGWNKNELVEVQRFYSSMTINTPEPIVIPAGEVVSAPGAPGAPDASGAFGPGPNMFGPITIPIRGLYSVQYVVGYEDLILYLNGEPIMGYMPHMIRNFNTGDVLSIRTRSEVTIIPNSSHLYCFVVARLG